MAELSDSIRSQIYAAFEEAGIKGGHGDCVASCRADYDACMAAGHSYCRSKLESCINSCPDGYIGGPERLKALLDRLDQIEASIR